MKIFRSSFLVFSSLLLLGFSSLVHADVSVAVTVDTTAAGQKIADDYAGLSYETTRELPDEKGSYYFSAQNAPLIKVFQTLGIKNLRVGGNFVDSAKKAIPTDADIDQFFGFAAAADAKVIYSFRLNHGDPAQSAEQAKHIADKYSANLICFSIGNEPDIYVHSYNGWLKIWRPIYDAINQAVPDAKYCGPSLTSNAQPWAHDFARDFYPSGKIVYVVQHQYAGGAGGKVTDPVAGRDELLSAAWHDIYQKYYDKFVPPLKESGAPYRLEEANNFYNGGAKDVSDSFASALWGLDYLYWWAEHGSQGINFHNGDEVAAGQKITPCRYASFTSVPDGYFVHPLAYGIKIFNLGSRGNLQPSTLVPDASAPDLNMVSYAVLGADKTLYVTLINKEHGPNGRNADVTIHTGSTSYSQGQTISLSVPGGDVAAKEGMILGADSIHHDGSWQEKWTDLGTSVANGEIRVKVPACSVLLVKVGTK
jgi:hypothetical protein